MDPNIPRGESWEGRPDPYWRRRVIVLAGALGVLGLLVWACSAGGGPGNPRQVAATGTPATGTPATGTPATGTPAKGTPSAGTPAAESPSAGAPAAETPAAAQQTASGAAPTSVPAAADSARSDRARKGRAPSGPHKHAAAPVHRSGSVCAPRDVVISLLESRRTYRQPTEPRFTIYLVNAGRRTCAFNADPRSLRLVIASGRVHQWSPADCTHGGTSRIVRLPRGVPFVAHVSWNRQRSHPGCSSPRTSALPGTYTATVTAGAVHSHQESFVLR